MRAFIRGLSVILVVAIATFALQWLFRRPLDDFMRWIYVDVLPTWNDPYRFIQAHLAYVLVGVAPSVLVTVIIYETLMVTKLFQPTERRDNKTDP